MSFIMNFIRFFLLLLFLSCNSPEITHENSPKKENTEKKSKSSDKNEIKIRTLLKKDHQKKLVKVSKRKKQ